MPNIVDELGKIGPGAATDDEADPEVARVRALLEARMLGLDASPSRVGRFALGDRIGAGAMGVVYSGFDDVLGRRVALKLLHREHSGAALHERLLREARAMAQLSHPNVAHVYEVGEHAGRSFVAMELVEGRTLRAWQRGAAPDSAAVIEAYRQAARGLAAAHAAGIVHRDFKPDNAIIDAQGRVKVLDFGLARQSGVQESATPTRDDLRNADDDEMLVTPLTRTGALIGTPAYMSPELLQGGQAHAGTDQFAFCVALYEALCGERPFAGTTVVELSNAMRSREPLRHVSKLPKWLRRVVLRGLAIDPALRWPSMDAIAAALAREPWSRRRWLAFAAVAIVGVGVGLAARAMWSETSSACGRVEDDIAEAWNPALRQRFEEAAHATALAFAKDTVSRVVAQLDIYGASLVEQAHDTCDAHSSGRESDVVADLRQRCIDRRVVGLRTFVAQLADVDAESLSLALPNALALAPASACADVDALRARVSPPEDPPTAAAAAALRERLDVAQQLSNFGRVIAAEALAQEVLNEASSLGVAAVEAEAAATVGGILNVRALPAQACTQLEAAYWSASRIGHDAVVLASAIGMVDCLGYVEDETGGRALDWARTADAAAARLGDREGEARASMSIARAQLNRHDFGEGRVALVRAIAIFEELGSAVDPALAGAWADLTLFDAAAGDGPALREHAERAVAIASQALGPEHPHVAEMLFAAGSGAAFISDVALAKDYTLRAIAIWQGAGLEHEANFGRALIRAGGFAWDAERLDEADDLLARGLVVLDRKSDQGLDEVADALNLRAQILVRLGRGAVAVGLASDAAAIIANKFGETDDRTSGYRITLGEALVAAGRPAEAIAVLERALAAMTDRASHDNRRRAETALAIARTQVSK